MTEKLKFMKGKEVKQDEMGPVLTIAKILIIPIIIAFMFALVDDYGLAPYLAFLIFAGLGYFEWRTENKNG